MSYTELSTYQLLCNKEIYQIIDKLCAEKFPDWDIETFERSVVGCAIKASYDEESVRAVIDSRLRELDTERPLKQYLESGKHCAFELFLYFPTSEEYDDRPYRLFWAYMAREFGDAELPMEDCRERYLSVLKLFNIRLYAPIYINIERFSVKNSYGESVLLSERDVRKALFTIERRNRAFLRKRYYSSEPVFLEKASEKFSEFFRRIYPHTRLKKDFNVHDLCFAIDSTCTEHQCDNILLLWGVYTGEPLNYSECAKKCGVSCSCIRQCERAVVRNVGHGGKEIIAETRAFDDRFCEFL